jgi:hypothetical protein
MAICACVGAAGLALLGATHLPILNPEQCPLSYTQAQVDRSRCIIGANIGANIGTGLVRELGILMAVVGGLALLVCLATGLLERHRG